METRPLVEAAMPGRDAESLAARIGIRTRHFADPADTVARVGAQVLGAALADAGLPATALRRIVLVNSHGGDHPIPATVNALLGEMGLHDVVGGFDLNNACTGFVSAVDAAARMVATGEGPVAVVVVELLSRWISPAQPRSYVVLGDAAAALVLTEAGGPGALLAADFGNDARKLAAVTLAHGAFTGADEKIVFGAPGPDFFEYAVDGLTTSVRRVLDRAGMATTDVDWWAFHQPNGELLDAFLSALGLPEDRTVRVVDTIGSVGAASAACTLDRLLATRPVRTGQTLMLCGVGAGASRGAVLLRVER
ncbi:ketoacyl-ACP synthase III [Myxococcota bacterium]|nr:ketoacyl-ACP synthase III [Myxococcota bacterium]